VVAIAVAAIIVLASVDWHGRWLALMVVAVLLAITFLKGTSPGGPGAWEQFKASRDGNGDS